MLYQCSKIDEPPQVSVLRKFTPINDFTPKLYVPHTCSRQCCLGPKLNLSAYSTLTRPLLVSWECQIDKKNKTSKHKSPCGRRLRNMTEIHKYLKMIHADLLRMAQLIQMLYNKIRKREYFRKCSLVVQLISDVVIAGW